MNKKITSISEAIESSRLLREKLLSDKDRPGYHFVCPEDVALPGDPNGAFYANGRYHLMYLYDCRSDKWRYGHMSSIDMVHWRSHPDPIFPDSEDSGIFSGGAFVDEDGTAYVTYRGLPSEGNGNREGIRIAYSTDIENHYNDWKKLDGYAIEATEYGILTTELENGEKLHIGVSDPSNIWRDGEFYYMQSGAYHVLHKYGLDNGCEEKYKGDFVELFRSRDLKNWEYVHRFYDRLKEGSRPGDDEDDMCPSFFPLTRKDGSESGKYIQVFISHNKGCQYYIGEYDRANEKFIPEKHGRMTWNDNTYFAPEAIMTPDGRQVIWTWLLDNRPDELNNYGWSGVYGLPRSIWMNDDGELGIAPIEELKTLRYNHRSSIDGVRSESCEIKLTVELNGDKKVGLVLKASEDESEKTVVYYDDERKELVFDAENSGVLGRKIIERAPFELKKGERLELDIYIDQSVIEVFANDRQAITRRVYTASDDSRKIRFFSDGNAKIENQDFWEMMPSNMF